MIDGIITGVAAVLLLFIAFVVLIADGNEETLVDVLSFGTIGRGWLSFNPITSVPFLLYGALFESSAHQATPGKMAVGVIVVGERRERITFRRALARQAISSVTSALSFGLVYLMVAFTRHKQGVHDMATETYVIVKPSWGGGTR